MTSPAVPWVLVVDDDAAVRVALHNLLSVAGFRVATFESAADLLGDARLHEPCCLVLDIQMPGVTGLDLQLALTSAAPDVPIVFLTAHGDVPGSVRAMKAGAVDFLQKPAAPADLIAAIRRALSRGVSSRERRDVETSVRTRLERLSSREREVLDGVVAGRLNKQIAGDLGIAERTVKFHRAHVMEKMGAGSVAELARMMEHLGPLRGGGPASTGEDPT
jgi:FixJ family two-component response regulator